jgi:hypothetical protein
VRRPPASPQAQPHSGEPPITQFKGYIGSLNVLSAAAKRHVFTGMDVNVQDGGCQIEYEDQNPRIHRIYLDELAKHGVKSGMGQFIDERIYAKTPA